MTALLEREQRAQIPAAAPPSAGAAPGPADAWSGGLAQAAARRAVVEAVQREHLQRRQTKGSRPINTRVDAALVARVERFSRHIGIPKRDIVGVALRRLLEPLRMPAGAWKDIPDVLAVGVPESVRQLMVELPPDVAVDLRACCGRKYPQAVVIALALERLLDEAGVANDGRSVAEAVEG